MIGDKINQNDNKRILDKRTQLNRTDKKIHPTPVPMHCPN